MTEPTFEPPMVIDFHAHLHEPGTTKWADSQNFDRTVILAHQENNSDVLAFCKQSGGRFIPYCFLDIRDIPKAVDQVVAFAEMGFRGVKFQPLTQRFLPHEDRMYPLWEAIQSVKLPITSHAGSVNFPGHCVNYADPSGWSQVAWDFPDLKIVIAHMGGDYHASALVIAEACENVYMDTAYLAYFCARSLPAIQPIDLIVRAVRYVGAHKVVFASEGMTPHYIWNSPEISLDDRKQIFWKNALAILGEPDV